MLSLNGFLKTSFLMQETPATSDPLMNLATSEIKARLVESYRRSVYAKSAKSRIRELASIVSKNCSQSHKIQECSTQVFYICLFCVVVF